MCKGVPGQGASPLPLVQAELVPHVPTTTKLPPHHHGLVYRPCPGVPQQMNFDERYYLGRKIGQGSSAVVRECQSKVDGRIYAVKIFDKSNLSPSHVKWLLQEVTIHQSLEHPNVIHVYDFIEDDKAYYMVMEMVEGGDVFERVTAKGAYTEHEARELIRVLLGAVKYLHDNDTVHRDLKPGNLLLKDYADDVSVKIADFGFAAWTNGDKPTLRLTVGTPWYMAPEVVSKRRYGKAVDMWSVGVILYILLVGKPPFYDKDSKILSEKIKSGVYKFPKRYFWRHAISDGAKDLISKLLNLDPMQRLTASQALEHPWILHHHVPVAAPEVVKVEEVVALMQEPEKVPEPVEVKAMVEVDKLKHLPVNRLRVFVYGVMAAKRMQKLGKLAKTILPLSKRLKGA